MISGAVQFAFVSVNEHNGGIRISVIYMSYSKIPRLRIGAYTPSP